MPKVSVIIPVYNGEKQIEQCIRSLQDQTMQDLEIICVDDGSTDSTSQIIQQLQKEDTRIKYLNQNNSGAGIARNLGIDNATGEYIGFIDSDDEYADSNVLEALYNTAIEKNVLVCGGSWQCDGDAREDNKRVFKEDKLLSYREYQFDFGFQRFIYQNNLIKKLRFPRYRVYEDPVFLAKVMDKAELFYALKKKTYHYSGSHNTFLPLDKTIDNIKGLTENLIFSSEKKYELLHRNNYERLITTASYFAENNLISSDVCLYYAIMDARAAIDIDLLKQAGVMVNEPIRIPVLDLIWNTSQKYLSLKSLRILKKMKGIGKKQNG